MYPVALQEVEGAQIPADDAAGRLTGPERPPALVGVQCPVVLVEEPQIIGPGLRRAQFDRSLVEQGLCEPPLGLLEVVAHPEAGPVRPGVGDHAGPGQDGVLHRGDVGVTTEDFGVGGDEFPVQVGKQFVAVEPADHGEDAGHPRVGERRVQVRHPRSHR